MIIEFLGPPGAGKSKLKATALQVLPEFGLRSLTPYEARILCYKRLSIGRSLGTIIPHRMQEEIHSAVSRRLLMLHRLTFAVENPRLIRHAIGQLKNHTIPFKEKRLVWEFFLRDCSFHRFFRNHLRQDEALVLSEGLVHRITSLHTSAQADPNRDQILDYIKLIPKADLLIWVKTSVDMCVERVILRGEYRRYLDKDLRSYIRNSTKTIEIALQGVKENGSDYVEVHNDGDLNETAANLRQVLANRFAHKVKKNRKDLAI